ncbi:MAG: hypothetical protein KGS72_12355 [Cyanobacteria bacterium REEB67]|nr:hypothetical protein [Cyanobacteria bacterium REEB67]
MSSTTTNPGTNTEASTSTSTNPSPSQISSPASSPTSIPAVPVVGPDSASDHATPATTPHRAASLCVPSAGVEEDWKNLYEASFPEDERMPVDLCRSMLAAGNIFLHKSTAADSSLHCFSLVTPMSNFLLLAYIATDQTKRSSGIGSKHMNALIDLLKKSHPNHLGLFLEIESTLEPNLSIADASARKRRLAFYERLGCQRLVGKSYLLPSYSPGLAARHGELLWFDFAALAGNDATLQAVIAEIYTVGYGISTSDPSYVKVVGQFAATSALPEVPSVTKVEEGNKSAAINGGTPPAGTKS